jgi:hypothetical protein
MNILKRIGRDMAGRPMPMVTRHDKSPEPEEDAFPPKALRGAIGGAGIWIVLILILVLSVKEPKVARWVAPDIILGILMAVCLEGLVICFMNLFKRKAENFIDHYDDDEDLPA